MTKVGWLVLGICAVLTYRQIPRFQDDLSLWLAAALVSPSAPRPAVNVATQYIVRGEFDSARLWMFKAQALILPPVRRRERVVVLQLVDRQQAWIDAFSASR